MINPVNAVPYLRTSREFPEDLRSLTVQMNKTYVDIANAVNLRTIAIFPTTRPSITGESWYLNSSTRRQTLRQIYSFTSFTAFDHGIDTSQVTNFTKIVGTVYTGTYQLPLPYVDASNAAVNVGIYVSSTQVLFTVGATPPAVVSGIIILEWLSQP